MNNNENIEFSSFVVNVSNSSELMYIDINKKIVFDWMCILNSKGTSMLNIFF